MKKISVVVPCYNEEENVVPMANAIREVFKNDLSAYKYEIIFIDNDSKDRTRDLIRELCKNDKGIKGIFNAKNFGQFNSPYYGISFLLNPSSATIPLRKGTGSSSSLITLINALSYSPKPVKCSICSTSESFFIVL